MYHTAKSGQTEHPIPKIIKHMIPEIADPLKPEHEYHHINAKRLYNLITNRLLTNTGICTQHLIKEY